MQWFKYRIPVQQASIAQSLSNFPREAAIASIFVLSASVATLAGSLERTIASMAGCMVTSTALFPTLASLPPILAFASSQARGVSCHEPYRLELSHHYPLRGNGQTAPFPEWDPKAARQFLQLLDPAAQGFTVQTFADGQTNDSLARSNPGRDEVLRLYQRGAGIYITVNQTDLTGRKSENIKRIRAIWQEDDEGHGGPFPLDPSLVVESSPGHFHRYWLVADDWPADEQGRADFAAVMERMVVSYGSDKNAKRHFACLACSWLSAPQGSNATVHGSHGGSSRPPLQPGRNPSRLSTCTA
jgi:hypothetical protein